MSVSSETFVLKTLELLEKEREAEIEESRILQENVSCKELERRGVCLLKLRITSRRTGLYGRTVLVLESFWPEKGLPSHSFTPGDIAGLSLSSGENSQEQLASGIVSRVSSSSLSVAFDETVDTMSLDDGVQYKLVKLANDVTYKRLKRALQELNTYGSGPSGQLIRVLFGESDISPPYSSARDGKESYTAEVVYFNERLDESQREAVRFALTQRELAIIHGPPGTGKTTTVVEIIQQSVKQKLKVLACAPSNIAVDNLVEQLSQRKTRVVRLGHPARLLHTIQKFSLDAMLSGSDETKLVADVRKDMDQTLAKKKKVPTEGERQHLRNDLKHLRKELRQREDAATRDILKRAEVVLATLTGATNDGPIKLLAEEHFDLVVIDECSQALEAACWIALLRGPRCILAGDHHQLPPTILSQKAAKEGLELTLMERQLKLHTDGASVMRMLTTQYRMHEDIMVWPSNQLYEGKLVAHPSVQHHLLKDLSGVEDNEDTSTAVLLVDTSGCNLWELDLPDEVSKGNEGEADIVVQHVEMLVSSGLAPKDIAVIAPYNLQVELLRLRLSQKYPKLEIKSVDGFQGREKEAVIISMVRSNEKGVVGFLAEDRRINVAITRARRHLAVVCDSGTVNHHSFLKSLVEYMTEHGEVRSAHQYLQGSNIDVGRPEYLKEQLSNRVQLKKRLPKQKKPNKTVQHHDTPKEYKTAEQTAAETRESIEKRENLQHILEDFAHDRTKQKYAFPATLNSHERFLVHEIAETLGLEHLSYGDGEERHIMVSKKSGKNKTSEKGTTLKPDKLSTSNVSSVIQDKVEHKHGSHGFKPLSDEIQQGKKGKSKQKAEAGIVNTASNSPDHLNDNISSVKVLESKVSNENLAACPVQVAGIPSNEVESSDMRTCDRCGKDIPHSNFELHQLRCTSDTPSQNVSKSENSQTKAKKKKKKTKGNEAAFLKTKVGEEEDFDALVAAAIKANTRCAHTKCKASTATLGQHCKFCAKRFCLSHHIPEVHGCGDRAKSHARMQISREGVLYSGSGVPDKKLDPTKRAHLQRKLDQKLGDLTDKRTKKPPKKS